MVLLAPSCMIWLPFLPSHPPPSLPFPPCLPFLLLSVYSALSSPPSPPMILPPLLSNLIVSGPGLVLPSDIPPLIDPSSGLISFNLCGVALTRISQSALPSSNIGFPRSVRTRWKMGRVGVCFAWVVIALGTYCCLAEPTLIQLWLHHWCSLHLFSGRGCVALRVDVWMSEANTLARTTHQYARTCYAEVLDVQFCVLEL